MVINSPEVWYERGTQLLSVYHSPLSHYPLSYLVLLSLCFLKYKLCWFFIFHYCQIEFWPSWMYWASYSCELGGSVSSIRTQILWVNIEWRGGFLYLGLQNQVQISYHGFYNRTPAYQFSHKHHFHTNTHCMWPFSYTFISLHLCTHASFQRPTLTSLVYLVNKSYSSNSSLESRNTYPGWQLGS